MYYIKAIGMSILAVIVCLLSFVCLPGGMTKAGLWKKILPKPEQKEKDISQYFQINTNCFFSFLVTSCKAHTI